MILFDKQARRAYGKKAEKYGLPSARELQMRMGLNGEYYDDETLILWSVLWGIHQFFDGVANTFELISTGSGPIRHMRDQKCLNKKERKEIIGAWKALNAVCWKIKRVGHGVSEEEVAKLIQESWDLHNKKISPLLDKISLKLEKEWRTMRE